MDHHVLEDAARTGDVVRRRRARIARGDDAHFRCADAAIRDGGLHPHEMRIEAAVETDHKCRAGLLDNGKAIPHPGRIQIDWLFAEHRFAGARELFDLLGMQVCRGTDYHRINVIGGGDGVQVPDLGTVALGYRSGGGFHRIEHGRKDGMFIAVNGAGMNLADAAGTKNGEADGHRNSPDGKMTVQAM